MNKTRLRLWGVCLMLVGVAWKGADDPVPMGPYDLRYPAAFGSRFRIPADNPMTQQGVYLGRLLFYESRLSSTGTVSCGSCHQQARAFTDGTMLSIGVSGNLTRRNAMSLTNLLWVRNLFWDGRSASLEEQALVPVYHADEMGLKREQAARVLQHIPSYPPLFQRVFGSDTITDARIAKAIAQFERTLISADSPYDRYLQGRYSLTAREQRGLHLFTAGQPGSGSKAERGGNCAHCHGGPRLVQELFHNNGLHSRGADAGRQGITGLPIDQGRFRVPTLRNIAVTAPYMHDGRLANLEDVLDHYSDHVQAGPTLSRELVAAQAGGLRLTGAEKQDLLSFLRLFTDSTFLTNPYFSDPNARLPTAKNISVMGPLPR